MKGKVVLVLCIGLILLLVPMKAVGKTYFNLDDSSFRYIIQAGDTFYQLASKFKVSVNQLQDLNPNLDPDNLQIGDEVKIPISDELDYYIVQPGDTLWEISLGTGIELDQIIAANDLDNPDSLEVSQVLLLPEEAIIVEDNNLKITQFSREDDAVNVAGLARAFEATINYALETEAGQVLEDGFTTASAAGPYWGIFNIQLADIPSGADYLVVFTIDARDGSRQDEVKLEL